MQPALSRRFTSRLIHELVLTGFIALAAETCAQDGYRFQENVMVPMRDGVHLAANVFMPEPSGVHPVVLMRTPYGKMGPEFDQGQAYAKRGYVMFIQDCRGRGDSQGDWDPFRHDAADGFDTQEWIGHQPWCNGKIGTAGGSYVGWTQWASAPLNSQYLAAMVPVVPFSDAYHEIAYPGGALQLSLLMIWGAAVGGAALDPANSEDLLQFLPLVDWDTQLNRRVPYLREWVEHPVFDAYWKQRGIAGAYDAVRVPVLNIGGWYDIFSQATLTMSQQVRRHSRTALVRRNQCVVMGPWAHGAGARRVGQIDFGESAQLDLAQWQLRWFDYWLTGDSNEVCDWPPYYLFVMGLNEWRGEGEWPLKRTQWTPYYLHGDGRANTADGDGLLSVREPGAGEPPDHFEYNPRDPVPTTGGNNLFGQTGPYDQSQVEKRPDVLVYSTRILDHPLEITGPIRLVLFAASSARDTDFTAKLVDVHPDGRVLNLCDGIIRARYRDSRTQADLIEPGRVYRYEIDLWVTSNVFLAGHRLRLEVSSSNFPRFDRNPNTGHAFGRDAQMVAARQSVFHNAQRPSHLMLPVIPGSLSAAPEGSK